MKESLERTVKEIKAINDITLKNEIVVFGSSYMKNFPFYELVNKCKLENAVYNRSIEDLTLYDALEVLQDCVLDIHPSKVFLCFGEKEYENLKSVDIYKEIVCKIRKTLPKTKIYLIELPEEKLNVFNEKVRAICDNKNVVSIKLTAKNTTAVGVYKEQFKQLSCFFRDKLITLTEIFAVASL